MKYKVKIKYPNSYFDVGDILSPSNKIPENTVGKFINEVTGWAWVYNPQDYPDVLEPYPNTASL